MTYNGYGFLGESVYNPFDILLFISEGHSYRNYWFETGSPSFLVKLFQRERYFLPELEELEVTEEILDSFDVERIEPVTLLFQAGYLTVKGTRTHMMRQAFRLGVPNQEVRLALNDQFINAYTGLTREKLGIQGRIHANLVKGDMEGLVAALRRLFAGIPWRNFTNNDLVESEGYYASVLYAFFASFNAEVIPEDIGNQGQVDLTIKLEGWIYVIEIKLERGADQPPTGENAALSQIQARGYSAKYRGLPQRGLFEVGLVFSSTARNLLQADWIAVRGD